MGTVVGQRAMGRLMPVQGLSQKAVSSAGQSGKAYARSEYGWALDNIRRPLRLPIPNIDPAQVVHEQSVVAALTAIAKY